MPPYFDYIEVLCLDKYTTNGILFKIYLSISKFQNIAEELSFCDSWDELIKYFVMHSALTIWANIYIAHSLHSLNIIIIRTSKLFQKKPSVNKHRIALGIIKAENWLRFNSVITIISKVMRDQTIIFFIKKLAGLFLFFRSFTNFFYRKTVCFSGIPTRFVRVEGVQADHLTTTTALKCQPNECSFCFKRQKLRFHIDRICFSLHYFCILFKGPSL